LLVLGVVVVGVFMSVLDLFIVNIAFPEIARDFKGTSLGSLSWVLNAYAIVFAALLIPAGRWSDAVGRKRAFLLGVGIFTAASAACAAAPSAEFLIGARAAQAVGGALLTPASLGLLLPSFPHERRHVAIGVWAAVGGVGAAAGPSLGGLLVQASWRWVFLVNVPVGVLTLAVGWRVISEIRHPDRVRADLLGAGILALAVGAAVVAIVQGASWGWTSARILALFVLALGLLAALARRSATHPAPIVEPELLRVRAFSVATLATALFFAAFAAMLLSSVLFLTEVWHQDILTTGLMLTPGPALAALFAVPGARLGARFGPGRVGIAGAVLFALGGAMRIAFLGSARGHRRRTCPAFGHRGRNRRPAPGAAGDRDRRADDRAPDRIGVGRRRADPGARLGRGRRPGLHWRLGAHDRRRSCGRADANWHRARGASGRRRAPDAS
jgi:EmrB/QacA subfamily drug resistance transporter